ncbi:MAG: TonB-dependent receptor, partial [Acidobacteria bacterium]|nr:TonB-dependent receptor [Acidobacteriota bacterium]
MLPLILLCILSLAADNPPKPAEKAAEATDAKPAAEAGASAETAKRVELNLLGKTDAAAGESRRNENVQFNLIDNNALKDLNVRMGTTATIVTEFRVDRNYFGVEFGIRPPSPLHVPGAKASAPHGSLYESHSNSVFSARSFFQVGGVKPAHDNDYGFNFGAPLWRGAALSLDGSRQAIRGSVNGNILTPKAEERTPLTNDPSLAPIVRRFLGAYPNALPNRTDIDERMLNTNSPQSIDTDNAAGRFDQTLGDRDRLTLRYGFTGQRVDAFQLLAGQNPNTHTRSHTARLTWNRTWSAETVTDFSAGFDRLQSLLVAEPNAAGPQVTIGQVITDLGPNSNIPIDRTQNLFRYAGQIRQVRGRHAWTAGLDLLRRQVNGIESSSHRGGTLQFRNDFGRDALTNLRMGIPSRLSFALGDVNRGFRNWGMQYYAGDSWRVNSGLTLNYGLRYQPVTKPTEVTHRAVIPYSCDCNNVALRFGFAQRLPGQWGVVHGAYGLHYGEIFPVTF